VALVIEAQVGPRQLGWGSPVGPALDGAVMACRTGGGRGPGIRSRLHARVTTGAGREQPGVLLMPELVRARQHLGCGGHARGGDGRQDDASEQ
jgi:hypothetical protein